MHKQHEQTRNNQSKKEQANRNHQQGTTKQPSSKMNKQKEQAKGTTNQQSSKAHEQAHLTSKNEQTSNNQAKGASRGTITK